MEKIIKKIEYKLKNQENVGDYFRVKLMLDCLVCIYTARAIISLDFLKKRFMDYQKRFKCWDNKTNIEKVYGNGIITY